MNLMDTHDIMPETDREGIWEAQVVRAEAVTPAAQCLARARSYSSRTSFLLSLLDVVWFSWSSESLSPASDAERDGLYSVMNSSA